MDENKEDLKQKWSGLESWEVSAANKLYKSYKEHYHIEQLSDLQVLKDLVWLEIVQERLKKDSLQISEATKKANIIPVQTLEAIDSIQDKILVLKQKIGLFEEKKTDSFLNFWDILKKKINKRANEYRASFQFRCPSCGKFALLVRKVEDYNVVDFKMFKGTVLYNEELFNLVYDKKITLKDVANIWGQPLTDYVEKMYNDIYLPERKSKEIQKIDNKDANREVK